MIFFKKRGKGTIINGEEKGEDKLGARGRRQLPKNKKPECQMCPALPNSESDIPENKIPISV